MSHFAGLMRQPYLGDTIQEEPMRLIHLLLGLPLIAASIAGIGVGCGDRNAEVTTSGPSQSSGSSTESGSSSSGAGGASAACFPGLKSIVLAPADSTVKLDGK